MRATNPYIRQRYRGTRVSIDLGSNRYQPWQLVGVVGSYKVFGFLCVCFMVVRLSDKFFLNKNKFDLRRGALVYD